MDLPVSACILQFLHKSDCIVSLPPLSLSLSPQLTISLVMFRLPHELHDRFVFEEFCTANGKYMSNSYKNMRCKLLQSQFTSRKGSKDEEPKKVLHDWPWLCTMNIVLQQTNSNTAVLQVSQRLVICQGVLVHFIHFIML